MELTYARWLQWCTWSALVTLSISFLAYISGFPEPLVPVDRLPALWQLPADEFLAATGAPAGWGWLGYVAWSDYLNLLGVSMLCLVTAVCYLRVAPLMIRGKEPLQAILALAQVLVLLAAASGLLAAGH